MNGPASTVSSTHKAGDVLTAQTPDGVTARATYDRAGRLLEIANTEASGTLSRFTYAYDAAGNRTELTTSIGTTYYGYDTVNRLTSACTGGSGEVSKCRQALLWRNRRPRERR